MIPYNQFRRNNAKPILRYNPARIRQRSPLQRQAFSESRLLIKPISNVTPWTLHSASKILADNYAQDNNMQITYQSPIDAAISYSDMQSRLANKSYSSGIAKVLVYYYSANMAGSSKRIFRFVSYYLKNREQTKPGPEPEPDPEKSWWDKLMDWFKGLSDSASGIGGKITSFFENNKMLMIGGLLLILLLVIKR